MNKKLNIVLKIVTIIAIIVVTFSVFYHFVFSSPEKNKTKDNKNIKAIKDQIVIIEGFIAEGTEIVSACNRYNSSSETSLKVEGGEEEALEDMEKCTEIVHLAPKVRAFVSEPELQSIKKMLIILIEMIEELSNEAMSERWWLYYEERSTSQFLEATTLIKESILKIEREYGL